MGFAGAQPSLRSHGLTWLDIAQDLHELNHLGWLEDPLDALGVEIRERALIKKLRVHEVPLRQVIDNQVEKLMLVRAQRLANQKTGEGAFRCLLIKPHQRADEAAEATIGLNTAERSLVGTGFNEDPLELGEVALGQRLVAPELDDGDVVLVWLEEDPRLSPERIRITNSFTICVDSRRISLHSASPYARVRRADSR